MYYNACVHCCCCCCCVRQATADERAARLVSQLEEAGAALQAAQQQAAAAEAHAGELEEALGKAREAAAELSAQQGAHPPADSSPHLRPPRV
jgi:hypothetical protein